MLLRAFSAAKFRVESHVARAGSGAVRRTGGCRQWELLAGEGKGLGAWATMRLLWSACMAVAGGREDDGEVLGTFSARVKVIIWEKKEATEGPLNKNDTLLASLLPLLYRT